MTKRRWDVSPRMITQGAAVVSVLCGSPAEYIAEQVYRAMDCAKNVEDYEASDRAIRLGQPKSRALL